MFQSYLNYVWVDLEGSLVCMVWADRAVDVSHWCVTSTDGFLLKGRVVLKISARQGVISQVTSDYVKILVSFRLHIKKTFLEGGGAG